MGVSQSEAASFQYKGKPATMSVMRNDGSCWGRIKQDGQHFDVTTKRDYYDYLDCEATNAFIRAAKKPGNVEPAVGFIDNGA